MNSCNGISADEKMCVPEELILGKLIFSEKKNHLFGPAGINPGVHIYKYKSEKKINDNIIMNSSISFPNFQEKKYIDGSTNPPTDRNKWSKFNNWKNTPVFKNSEFCRYMLKDHFKVRNEYATLSDFYGARYVLLELILPNEIELKINRALKSNTSLYSFGGYRNQCILLISPEENLAFYLDNK